MMDWNEVYRKVSEKTGKPVEVVKEAYTLFWRFIKDTIEALPLKDNLSEEEFSKLRTNFNIPSVGKLTCTYDRYLSMNRRYKYILDYKREHEDKEDKANVHKDCDNLQQV